MNRYTTIALFLLLAVVLLNLLGCTASSEAAQKKGPIDAEQLADYWAGYVDVRLPNGQMIPCILMSRGVSCDWAGNRGFPAGGQ